MAIDTSLLTSYTWAQLKTAATQAIMTSLVGGNSLSINGRQIMRVSLQDAKAIYAWACEMEVLEDPTCPGGEALVKIDERV